VNNRLKQLRDQALEQYTYEDADGNSNRGTRLNEQKFAELIIQECIDRAETIALKHQQEDGSYAAGKKAGAFECARDLQPFIATKD